jgi:Tfp pilus assembly protein PilO
MRQQQLTEVQKMKYIIDLLPMSVTIYQTTVEYLIDRANELLEDLKKKSTVGAAAIGLPARTIKLLSKTMKVQTTDYKGYLKSEQQQQQQQQQNPIKIYQIMKSRNSRYSDLSSLPSRLDEVKKLYSSLATLEAQLYSE